MKRTIPWILLTIVAIALLITVCSYRAEYQLTQPDTEISKIEIVDVSNYPVIYKYNEYERITSLVPINEADWVDFLAEFRRISRKKPIGNELFIDGMPSILLEGPTIRITYKDGSFELIGCKGNLYYVDKRDKTERWYEFDKDAFQYLIDCYSQTKTD